MLEHLDELRKRLVAAVAGCVVGILVAIIPLPGYGSITETAVKLLAERAPAGKLTTLGPGEGFFTFLQVALIIGIALAMPVIIYQLLGNDLLQALLSARGHRVDPFLQMRLISQADPTRRVRLAAACVQRAKHYHSSHGMG